MSSPLYLPKGSVRAILVLVLTGTVCYCVIKALSIPDQLWTLVTAGVSFYTGMKVGEVTYEHKK